MMLSVVRLVPLVVLGLLTIGACVQVGGDKQEAEAGPAGAGETENTNKITSLKQRAQVREFLPGGICHDPHKELRGHIVEFYFDPGDEAPDFAIPRLEVLEKTIEGKEFMSTKEYFERFTFKASHAEALYEIPDELPDDHPDKQIQCEKVRLSSFRGKKPVVLLFTSFTCPACSKMRGFERLYKEHGDRVQFFFVYIREGGHWGRLDLALGKGLVQWPGKDKIRSVKEDISHKPWRPYNYHERIALAKATIEELGTTMPVLIDDLLSTASQAYYAWPDRACLIDIDGKIAFHGDPYQRKERGGWFAVEPVEEAIVAILANEGRFVPAEKTDAEDPHLDRAGTERESGMGERTSGKPTTGMVPLTELGQGDYKGEDGGLYGGGSNVPPPAHARAAAQRSALIVPLDAAGEPADDGKIVLISIGMSNTSQEFSVFKRIADGDDQTSPSVVIVNGAQGGRDALCWAGRRPQGPEPWSVLDQRLEAAGVTPPQVQAAWMKQAIAGPAKIGEFPDHARQLQADMETALNIAKKRYPSLRLVFISGRIYAGYAGGPLNPEPYAYESAFAVRWVIQEQIAGSPKLNYASERGEVLAPVVLWGPYLWGDGVTSRKADGLVWEREDLGGDGTHPSGSGQRKVADMLLEFFKANPYAKPWFMSLPDAE